MLQFLNLLLTSSHFLWPQQLSTEEIDGEIGIFQRVSGQEQNYRLRRLNFALCNQLLKAGKRDGRGRLAADSLPPNLCFGDRNLSFAYLLAVSAGFLDDSRGFSPRCDSHS